MPKKRPRRNSPAKQAPLLPGDLSARARRARLLRVNHAGEYGAKRIYEGQLAVLRGKKSEKTIARMAAEEQAHLDFFAEKLTAERVRPTALFPLWHVLGYALGAGTALLGERAAMACTVAVEEVIDAHYARQIDSLADSDPALKKMLIKFRADEAHHRDIGLEQGAARAPFYPLLKALIAGGTRAAITLAERV